MTKRIALDIDGVLCNLIACWLGEGSEYHREFGDFLQEEDILSWDIERYVLPAARHKVYREYLADPTLYLRAKPYPGALKCVEALSRHNWDIVFATIHDCHTGEKLEWLKRHGFWEATQPLHVYCETTDKLIVLADILVDDCPYMLLDWTNSGRQAIVVDRPWNRNIEGMPRLKTWTIDELVRLKLI